MPFITFTKDVTLEGVDNGPHYLRGACHDVSQKIAQQWVSKGVAVLGVPAVELVNSAKDVVVDFEEDTSTEEKVNEPLIKEKQPKWKKG